MEDIYLLVDYKGHFGSKHGAIPYRSGLVKEKLSDQFARWGYRTVFLNFCDVNFQSGQLRNQFVLFTSSEDRGLHYKSFIEDVVLGLEIGGAYLIPAYRFLRAHHNKVFMEILRDQMHVEGARTLEGRFYGTREELDARLDEIPLPGVVKPAAGAMSTGLHLCRSHDQLRRAAFKVSLSRHLWSDLWDLGRRMRRSGYIRESRHRKKFVVQSYQAGLENDWKILIYGKKYYVLMRKTRRGDFRASGSGYFDFVHDLPEGLLDFAASFYRELDVPHLSLDIGIENPRFHLFEFQAIYFGTLTIEKAPFYFTKRGGQWQRVDASSDLEEEFAQSVVEFIGRAKGEASR